MEYTSVEVADSTEVRMPAKHNDDEDRRQAQAWLFRLAVPYYNRMLAAERDGRIPEALREARMAAHYGAFAPRIVTSAFLVAAKHGDFDLAQRLLGRIRTFGLDGADDYEALLRQRVERWNQFLNDPAALRDTYQQQDVSVSYRELLLLADRLDAPPTEVERSHLMAVELSGPEGAQVSDAVPDTTDRTFSRRPALVVAVVVGALLGGGGFYLSQDGGEETVPETTTTASASVPDSLVPRDRYATALQVSTHLAEGQPVRAYWGLGHLAPDSARTEALDSLRTATHEALYRAAGRAWDAGDYERVVQVLTPVRDASVGSTQDRLYRLGVAAAQTGRDTLVVEVLRELMPRIDAQHPHYEAQAAYLLVKRGPPAVAKRHARLIAEKYSDTIYFNSVVRAQLENP
ncbi:hypothetical protein GGP81_003259 [Salinibacter ruber]|uniref:hypothetical protein n=1 Tax=Salinibacter ruber TaxID=146919 RepID=UPI0021686022|nr:hypothetical protein [Salinibacter ruber]MCS3956711.1 hypothetical protein [Salinibacter ruber]